MSKSIAAIFFIIIGGILPAAATGSGGNAANTSIVPAPGATHIVKINRDTLIIATGSTYRFTVDTPEDKGLVSTGITANELPRQLAPGNGLVQQYTVMDKNGTAKKDGTIETGDRLIVTAKDGKTTHTYFILVTPAALSGQLRILQTAVTVNTVNELELHFTAGQRSPDATVRIYLPQGINVTMDNTTVNVIGRGDVKLSGLSGQSIGRTGNKYSYSKVGDVSISKSVSGGSVLIFSHLDLRPANGPDLRIVIAGVKLSKKGKHIFRSDYTISKPEILTSAGVGTETAMLTVTSTISDFKRVINKSLAYRETPGSWTTVNFTWTPGNKTTAIQLMQSTDKGKTWKISPARIDLKNATVLVTDLPMNKLFMFRLLVKDGTSKGYSNPAYFYSGKMDVKDFGVRGTDGEDNTEKINGAIAYLESIGGGTLLFSKGVYSVRTVHLKSNVYLYIDKDAVIKAMKGGDAPETTWFSDKKYRSGLSPTDTGPYEDPENYMTKQDVGHHYFRNTMFFGERLDNVKIIGNGLITGNGVLVTGDRVMNNAADHRSDKMFTLKLCTNLEIGGVLREDDLWYDAEKDVPYYIRKDGSKDYGVDNMLHIDRGGHFALLATGTDNINVHDTYFAKDNTSSVRDVYDFMACNNVTVTNIYSRVSSDDIVKPGSDCSLGFTRPASNYKVRNIIGDTNCNLFQIGSETADDIMDIHVDNIYVLGANKAGFSISTNDGAHIKDIHLNCGHTGTLHSRSKMYRTFSPFFISISNRGRVLGAEVGKYSFTDNGEKHNELLVKNINIGQVENIIINGVDIAEVYAGSSYGGNRWKAYDGTQRRATPIVAGYSLPEPAVVEGGLNFKLPNGRHTGYITNVVFNDVHVLVKGGNPVSDTSATPPELGVGQYNVSNLKTQPSYGIWARHVKGLKVSESTFNFEKPDGRYAIFLDDVLGATIQSVKLMNAGNNNTVLGVKRSQAISTSNIVYFKDTWGNSPTVLVK
jgi:polygalacturonase